MQKLLFLLTILLISITNLSCSTLNAKEELTQPIQAVKEEKIFYRVHKVCVYGRVNYSIEAKGTVLLIPTEKFCTIL